MDGLLRKLTPIVLLALAVLVWFEPTLMPASFKDSFGETGFLVEGGQRLSHRVPVLVQEGRVQQVRRPVQDGAIQLPVPLRHQLVQFTLSFHPARLCRQTGGSGGASQFFACLGVPSGVGFPQ